jgi:hypothetical protein
MYHIVRHQSPPVEPAEPEKKERVIHTRVPESLESELRKRAEDLGISVSNLVRNVLGHAFGLIGGVVADGHAVARAARGSRFVDSGAAAPPSPAGGRTPPHADGFDDVLAWQPVVLGKNAVCARCNAILTRGSDAAIGTTELTGVRHALCLACLDWLRNHQRNP